MSITYDQWANSDPRDRNPIVIESGTSEFPERILYDRFFRVFVLEVSHKVIDIETLLANP